MNRYIILIIGMSIVTIIPRILPLILHNIKIHPFIEEWIKGVPFAALAALTIPGIIYLDADNVYPGIVGLTIALITSLIKAPMYIVIFTSLISVYIYYLIF